MEKFRNSDSDITKERYKGASPGIAALGEATWSHWIIALAGLGIAGTVTFIAHKPAKWIVDGLRDTAAELTKDTNKFAPKKASFIETMKKIFTLDTVKELPANTVKAAKESVGKLIFGIFGYGGENSPTGVLLKQQKDRVMDAANGMGIITESIGRMFENKQHGFGYALLNHTSSLIPGSGYWFRPYFRKISDRLSIALSTGGLFGLAGFLFGPIYYGIKGARNARQGEDQFERAKEEIIDLRNEYARAKLELDDLKTAKDAASGDLAVAKDNPPKLRDEASETVPLAAAATERDSGNGKVDDPGWPKDPKFPQPPKMPWGDEILAQKAAAEAKEATRA